MHISPRYYYTSTQMLVVQDAVSDYYIWVRYKADVTPASALNANNKKLSRILVEFARR